MKYWFSKPEKSLRRFFGKKGTKRKEKICKRREFETKETTLERADFTLQLLMFVTAEKERRRFITLFISSFCQLLSPPI